MCIVRKWIGCVIAVALAASSAVAAPTVPGPADSGRIEPLTPIAPPLEPAAPVLPETKPAPALIAPEGAAEAKFTLRSITITGATAFSDDALKSIYAASIGHEITLADIYTIANAINDRYRAEGYFLTRVRVPDQRIEDGAVTIQVIEGYIGAIALDGPLASYYPVRGYIERIRAEKPLRAATLESALLGLNDLPGQTFRAVLSAMPSGQEGASELTLIPQSTTPSGSIGIDNYGSQFLGPHQISGRLSASLLPMQLTNLYGLTSMPTRELSYGMIRHSAVVAPDVTLLAEAGVTHAEPGYRLRPLDIDSVSTNIMAGLRYQLIRQREENLAATLSLEGRDIHSDIASSVLTREHTRVARLAASYDSTDRWNGSNVVNLTLSQGIDGLGASDEGDANLSRSEAEPDFEKLELLLARTQELTEDWSAQLQLSGQVASGPLASSEEFGYGGQNFGRAYDASEIVGDHGAAGMVELRYNGFRNMQPVNLQPYVYYDYGFVINEDAGQSKSDTASSAGGGFRFATDWGQVGNVGLAVPLTRKPIAPIYGRNGASPRAQMQIQQNF